MKIVYAILIMYFEIRNEICKRKFHKKISGGIFYDDCVESYYARQVVLIKLVEKSILTRARLCH